MAEPKTRTRKPVAPHLQEAKAMGSIAKTLDALDAHAKERVMAWVTSHYAPKAQS